MDTEAYTYDDRYKSIKYVDFSIFGNEDVRKASALGKGTSGIDVPELYDGLIPKPGGLIDSRMGVTDNYLKCGTCDLNTIDCVGHFGHLELAEPVYHIGYIRYIIKILGCICLKCSRLLINKSYDELNEILSNKVGKARLSEIRNLVKNVTHCQRPDIDCGTPVSKIRRVMNDKTGAINLVIETNLSSGTGGDKGKTATQVPKTSNFGTTTEGNSEGTDGKKKYKYILAPSTCYNILKLISDADCLLMGLNPKYCRPENMIYKVLPIPPIQVRPTVRGDFTVTGTAQNDLTHKLGDIVKNNIRVQKFKESQNESTMKYGNDHIHLLQYHVAVLFDNETLPIPKSEQKNRPFKSLSARIKNKDGRIRNNLMAKRTNHSARTVITGDATLDIDQVGVPLEIAMNLTFPDIVTNYNIKLLQKIVDNGKYKHPGANYVYPISIDNKRRMPIDLRYVKNIKLQVGDIVERHLMDNDYVLFNRQPTLQKQSMMGHRVKVDHSTLTFRINANVVKPYNADFDGDEMNLHNPQSIQTCVELIEIANIKHQFIKPGNSKTSFGIIQDGLLGSYNLTRTKNINWRTAMNMLANTKNGMNTIKKNMNYSGSDLFSKIIPKSINLDRPNLNIINGFIKNGFMSSNTIGEQKWNNLIHLTYDDCGPDSSITFLNDIQRLAYSFNYYNGFTFAVRDISIDKKLEDKIKKIIFTKKVEVDHMITEMENNSDMFDSSTFEQSLFYNLGTVMPDIGKMVLDSLNENNGFKIMIDSGTKGSSSHTGAVCGCLALQTLEGKRMQKKLNNRALPYYSQNDDTAGGRGFVFHSLSRGLEWEEFVFHLMNSREGLIDTAIKTSHSGYIQRKLVKSMEDAMIMYDGTVRTSTNVILQFIFGDNGVDTVKQIKYYIKLVEMDDDAILNEYVLDKKYLKKYIDLRNKLRLIHENTKYDYTYMRTEYMIPVNIIHVYDKIKNNKDLSDKNKKLTHEYIFEKINDIIETFDIYNFGDKNSITFNDIRMTKTIYEIALYDFFNPKKCIEEITTEQLDKMMTDIKQKYIRSLAEPGEMVGTNSGQSLGEPLTQMSVPRETIVKLLIKKQNEQLENKLNINCTNNVMHYNGCIGKFIDSFINNESHDSIVINVSDYEIFVQSISENEKQEWSKISELSRHPANGGMMKITTLGGHVTSSTLSHSHLQKLCNKIVPVKGSELKIGDKLPTVSPITFKLLWDPIVNIEYYETNDFVYDFTVPGNESFLVDTGVYVHNTLNTFHFSGLGAKGATNLGVSRINELLNFSKKPKTPIMEIRLLNEFKKDKQMADKLSSYIKSTTLSQILKKIDVIYDPTPYKKNGIMDNDNVKHVFNSFTPSKNKCQSDITNLPWLIRIELDKEKLLQRDICMLDIKTKFCHNWEKKLADIKSLKKDEKNVLEKITACAVLSNTDYDMEPILHIRIDMTDFNNSTITDIIDMITEKFKIKGINGVSDILGVQRERTFQYLDNGGISFDDDYVIYSKGINMTEIRYLWGIDIYKTFTNDIATIYDLFGIEAARIALIKEFTNVYDSNGNTVNYQYLSILADVMTNNGSIISIDRHGMNRLDMDPLSRASFEKPIELLINAAVFSERDHMKSVSSRIMAGMTINGGTGLCNLILDIDAITNIGFNGNAIENNPLIEDLVIVEDNTVSNEADKAFMPI